MMRLLLCLALFLQCKAVIAQKVNCNLYVHRSRQVLHGKVYEADSAITVLQSEGVTGRLHVNDAGMRETINFDFIFADANGRGADVNDLLVLHFDHYKAEFIARSRRIYSGKITFAIVRPTETRLGTVLTEEDALFYDKLQQDLLTYFEIRVNGVNRKMYLSPTQAIWLRDVMICLSKRTKY